MNLFTKQIASWRDWGAVFQSIPDFTPVAVAAYREAGLPFVPLAPLTPGTNGVFRSGDTVIKLFAPRESGVDSSRDFETELFAGERAGVLGIQAPRLLAHGCVRDKYDFYYTITEYINGTAFESVAEALASVEKTALGKQLREITNRMNTPCRMFNGIDFRGKDRQKRWTKYSETFQRERMAYIIEKDYGEKVFVHGDINGDNLILTKGGGLHLIDFADALLAPVCYEHALIAAELFRFDPDFMCGYFSRETPEEAAALCFNGLLIHDFGGDIISQRIAGPKQFCCLEDLQAAIRGRCRF